MRYSLTCAALLAASLAPTVLADDGCIQSPAGNWYCKPAKAISFTNFGKPGTYSRVTNMDKSSGQCQSQQTSFSGGMAPLDQEVRHQFFPLSLATNRSRYHGTSVVLCTSNSSHTTLNHPSKPNAAPSSLHLFAAATAITTTFYTLARSNSAKQKKTSTPKTKGAQPKTITASER